MKKNTKHLLQLFAEGSGQSAASGEAPAAAGQDRAPAQPETQAAAAEAAQARMSWEQVKADPEYSSRMQAMVQERVKNLKQAQSDLETLTPALSFLAKKHGLDPEKPDYAALSRAITGEKTDDGLYRHYRSLVEQGIQLEKKYPGFNLQQELQNPLFARLTAPGTGIGVEDAYYTVHRRQIQSAAMETAARKTAQQIANAIRAGGRPEENGMTARGPSVGGFDYRSASREQREALKARIRQAGARGEKLYPGSM